MAVKLNINSVTKEYDEETTYLEIANEYQKDYKDDIVLVLSDNKLRELDKKVEQCDNLKFITTADPAGRSAYRRSMSMLLQKAIDNLYKEKKLTVRVCHSISQGYFFRIDGMKQIDKSFLLSIKLEMLRLSDENIPIVKKEWHTDKARKMYRKWGMYNRELILKYRSSSQMNVYEIDGYCDYYYGYMVPNTGYLKYFDLDLYEDGFVLLFPNENTKLTAEFKPSNKIFKVLDEASNWGSMLNSGTIGAFNEALTNGLGRELVLVQEALMEKKIGEIAEKICSDKNKKFVMVAGPSSSGKTTFANRLCIQLLAHGAFPHLISLDDFYKDRDQAPIGPDNLPDFECLEALNVELFEEDMNKLLNHEEINLPKFNFVNGRSEDSGKKIKLQGNDVLVIEGIHGLNEKLCKTIPKENIFRIYISALTQLNIDEHNLLSTTDGRLLRRIVRDARTRGTDAKSTIRSWGSVRRGEEKHIFPFQDKADVMFNSALIYELSVLKPFAQPQLYAIDRSEREYVEAKRLLKLMDYVLPMPSEGINYNSIIREFIGGSVFNV